MGITARQDVFLLNIWRQQLPVSEEQKSFHENWFQARKVACLRVQFQVKAELVIKSFNKQRCSMEVLSSLSLQIKLSRVRNIY